MALNPIKTGVLAYGMSGKVFHAPFLHTNDQFQFSAVTERTKKAAHERYPDVKSYDSVDALIADESLELIIINTPNFTHYEYAEKALKAGKHVLIEKPVAVTANEAKQLFSLAKSVDRQLLVYQNRRYNSDFLSVKKVLEEGRLGKLIDVYFRYDRYRLGIGAKYFKEEPYPGSGLAYDLGPHLLDQALSLFGRPEKYTKTLGKNRPGTQTDDYFFIHLEYATGLQVYLSASLLVAKALPAYVVNGVNGTFIKQRTDTQEDQLLAGMMPGEAGFGIEKPGSEGELTVVDADGKAHTEHVPSLSADYTNLFNDVYATLREGKTYPVKEEDVVWQLEILES
ncbi:MAG: Gfo/Idh/MocA family oxidoreductase [Mucilaginibacter polytrichastri]|nr:Gfo/Idh/MocA family oxidoreductase [Mucilaginibacter polytrichastri]